MSQLIQKESRWILFTLQRHKHNDKVLPQEVPYKDTHLLKWFINETGASEPSVDLYRLHFQLHLLQCLMVTKKIKRDYSNI